MFFAAFHSQTQMEQYLNHSSDQYFSSSTNNKVIILSLVVGTQRCIKSWQKRNIFLTGKCSLEECQLAYSVGKPVIPSEVQGFPGRSDGKASAYNAGDPGSIPGSGRSPGEGHGNPLQCSCLENPVDGGAWWATVHGIAKNQTRLSNFTFTVTYS